MIERPARREARQEHGLDLAVALDVQPVGTIARVAGRVRLPGGGEVGPLDRFEKEARVEKLCEAFEAEKPEEFLDLVQDLRETESSKYTVRDTPMYTCRRSTIEEILETVG